MTNIGFPIASAGNNFKHTRVLAAALILLFFVFIAPRMMPKPSHPHLQLAAIGGVSQNGSGVAPFDIVFVSRQIQKYTKAPGYIFGNMPGAGPNSRFTMLKSGKLQIYSQAGVLNTLIDGSNPTPATFNITDVQSVDVSYDGTTLVFAALTDTVVKINPTRFDTVYTWRIFRMGVDGSGLKQITHTDTVISNSQFNIPSTASYNNFTVYQDGDPVWLPDGRICFSSTRYPSNGEYAGARTTQLWVMNSDGTMPHRITTERNGADRPVVDPLTGQIVFSRWWFNARFPRDSMSSIAYTGGGYNAYNGLTIIQDSQSYKPGLINFNSWVSSSVNPDGSSLHMFAGSQGRGSENFIVYGCGLTSSGSIVNNYFPDNRLLAESGFGGINIHPRGAGNFKAIDGYANETSSTNAPSGTAAAMVRYYSTNGFATDASVMPDNLVVYSWATDFNQDYGIYVIDTNGRNKVLIYDNPGTAELRPKAVAARTVPPIIVDNTTQVASTYPPLQTGPYNPDGNFVFKDFNVFFNGPVDMDITSAPAIGSVSSIRFYMNQQRTRPASAAQLDWPILLAEMQIPMNGKVVNFSAPANVPLFEQLRTSHAQGYTVPTTGGPLPSSTAQVMGMNYAPPGSTFGCVGCHRGHTMIPFPTDTNDAAYTNLAPGAALQVSSAQITANVPSVIDRKVMLDTAQAFFWTTPNNNTTGQWVKLVFPVPIKIRAVVPYNIPKGGPLASSIQVNQFQINLYSDAAATLLVDSQVVNTSLSSTGFYAAFNDVVAQSVQVKILSSTGTFQTRHCTGLAEVEVIGTGDTTTISRALASKKKLVVDNSLLKVFLYPNPVANQTYLNIQTGENGRIEYTIHDLTGNIILANQLDIATGEDVKELIDLSKQSTGVYILSVTNGSLRKTFKLVKL